MDNTIGMAHQQEHPIMKKNYEVINQTEHPILVRIRRVDKARELIKPDDILINREIIGPNKSKKLPNPSTNQFILDKIPLGMRIDHAGTSLNPSGLNINHTPLIGGLPLSETSLLLYELIIVYYNERGKIDVRFESDDQEDSSHESDNP